MRAIYCHMARKPPLPRGRPPSPNPRLIPVHVRLTPRVHAIMLRRAHDEDRPLAYFLRCIIDVAAGVATVPKRRAQPARMAAE